jgi:predicted MFS family arabinose efflux permease
MGWIITATQTGYGLGLLFLVPLGDKLDRKKLIATMLLASSLLLAIASRAASLPGLSSIMGLVGMLAVVVQIVVAYTASLTSSARRGEAIGMVTSGVVLGILLARVVAGLLGEWGSWRMVLQISALTMLLMALLFIRTAPQEPGQTTPRRYGELMLSLFQLWRELPVLRVRAMLALLIFMDFSLLWTSLVFPLSGAPHYLGTGEVGLFGLAGIAGALAARRAGLLADRGQGQRVTGWALLLLALSWALMACGGSSLPALTLGIILLDFAVQAVHVTSQSLIFAQRPQATSRLVALYMAFYSLGSAIGAWLATHLWAMAGWPGVTLAGAIISGLALGYWALFARSVRPYSRKTD